MYIISDQVLMIECRFYRKEWFCNWKFSCSQVCSDSGWCGQCRQRFESVSISSVSVSVFRMILLILVGSSSQWWKCLMNLKNLVLVIGGSSVLVQGLVQCILLCCMLGGGVNIMWVEVLGLEVRVRVVMCWVGLVLCSLFSSCWGVSVVCWCICICIMLGFSIFMIFLWKVSMVLVMLMVINRVLVVMLMNQCNWNQIFLNMYYQGGERCVCVLLVLFVGLQWG